MKQILTISLILFVVLLAFSTTILEALNLEVNDENFKQSFENLRFYGLLLLPPLSLFWKFKWKEGIAGFLLRSFFALAAASFIYALFIVSIFADMCIWTNNQVLYVNAQNDKIQIIEREFGCGATDSGPPIVKNFKVTEVTTYFLSISEINIEEIDKNNWIQIDH